MQNAIMGKGDTGDRHWKERIGMMIGVIGVMV